MNRSIKSLIVATGVAVATLTVTVPAHADGIGDFQVGPIVDPEPQPDPQPQPPANNVGDLKNAPQCTHGCGGWTPPKDLADAPKAEPKPEPQPQPEPQPEPQPKPDQVENGGPLEADDPDLDQGCFTGCDLPEEPVVGPAVLDSPESTVADELAPTTSEDGGIDPLWFVLGGAGAGGLILAAAARRRRQQAEENVPQA